MKATEGNLNETLSSLYKYDNTSRGFIIISRESEQAPFENEMIGIIIPGDDGFYRARSITDLTARDLREIGKKLTELNKPKPTMSVYP